jgi:hypothetical protein
MLGAGLYHKKSQNCPHCNNLIRDSKMKHFTPLLSISVFFHLTIVFFIVCIFVLYFCFCRITISC